MTKEKKELESNMVPLSAQFVNSVVVKGLKKSAKHNYTIVPKTGNRSKKLNCIDVVTGIAPTHYIDQKSKITLML